MKWDRDGMELRIVDTVGINLVDTLYNNYSNPGYILNEALMDPIQAWCWETMPTVRRTAFDTFRFEREADMSAFLLKWS
jgi:hypothetical protein